MNDLLKRAIDAQGGLEAWKQFNTFTAHLQVGGTLWEGKGHGGTIDEVDVEVNLLEQKVSHIPSDQWHTAYTPERIALETGNGETIEELYNPRASFKGHAWETQWSNLQLGYFTGYATWNYINTPYQFTRPGFKLVEIEPWIENNETWRRLKVEWPKHIHTHSKEQTLYIDSEGLIRRLDYQVEISGNAPAAHYLSDYKEFSGIKMATKRTVYAVDENNKPLLDVPVIVSIAFSNIQFH